MKRFFISILLTITLTSWSAPAFTFSASRAPESITYTQILTPEVCNTSYKAWNLSRNGLLKLERVVLVVAVPNDPAGAVTAKLLPATFEENRFTFTWERGTIAVLHTHHNEIAPEPSETDIKLAEQKRVPVFTITSKGLFVYDPLVKHTVQLERGTGWLLRSSDSNHRRS